MSQVFIEVAQVFAKRSVQQEFIVTLRDEYGRDFIETEWKKIPDSDLDILAECAVNFNGDSAGATLLQHVVENEGGILICGTYYDFDEIREVLAQNIPAD